MCFSTIFKFLLINKKKNKILNLNNDNDNDNGNVKYDNDIKNDNDVNYKLIDDNRSLVINGEIYVECNLCFDIYNLKELPVLYPCGHRLFCKLCIIQIINNANNCPTCRKEILDTICIYENLEKVQNKTKLNIT